MRSTGPAPAEITRVRKAEHIELARQPDMQAPASGFEDYRFEHRALPEVDFDEIDTSVSFLGRPLSAPLLVSCMTGGTDEATRINRNLAIGAESEGIAVGVGSQRTGLEDPAAEDSFRIRRFAPSVPLLSNLGAVQLNYGYGLDECRRAVEMIEADALVFHLNPLQEAIQPEGQRNFAGLARRMGEVGRDLGVPVIAKEVGSGISRTDAVRLLEVGISTVDTAGMGGTSWARIEAARARDPEIGELFADWGIPTLAAIRRLCEIDGLTVIGSGGIRNGVDAAKAIATGARLAGMAVPFLQAACESSDAVARLIRRTVRALKICMFCVGARTVPDLRDATLLDRRGRDAW